MLAPAKIGIVGTGFIGLGLAVALESMKTLTLSAILTRRDTGSIDSRHRDKLTTSLNRLIDQSDLIVECTGDAIYATEIVDRVLSAGRPIVTMNSEFHVTTGSYFTDRGVLTESQGDQPGSIAALAEQAREMGLEPVVYGNRKGFYNPDPTLEQMQYWAAAQGISLRQVTSSTDGTKIQIEAALVANGLGARIAQNGLLALEADDIQSGGMELARHAERLGAPISDYVLAPKAPPGVFLVVKADARHHSALKYLKLGDGPYHVLAQNYHLCHLEIPITIRRSAVG